MTLEGLASKLAKLEEICRVAEAELAALEAREERVRELEADRDALLAYYAEVVPEALGGLSGEERMRVYGILQLEVKPDKRAMRSAGRFVVEGRGADVVSIVQNQPNCVSVPC
jgi:hypothetical protein